MLQGQVSWDVLLSLEELVLEVLQSMELDPLELELYPMELEVYPMELELYPIKLELELDPVDL